MSGIFKVDVDTLIDESGLNRLNVGIVVIGFLIMLLDGYDVGVLGYAAPGIIKDWHIAGRAVLGPVFSASLFGMLFGSLLFGFCGDRYGRKPATVVACLFLGTSTLAAAFSGSLAVLMVLRFLTGVGMGGLAPNAIALTSEYAPKRFRASMVILMYTGITFGGAVAGWTSAYFAVQHGWQSLFLVGGAAQLLMAGMLILILPESLKFLVLKIDDQRKARALASRMTHRAFDERTTFYTDDAAHLSFTGASPRKLFSGRLALVTPLLWTCMASGLMGYYFLVNWLPTLLGDAHLAVGQAAMVTAIFQVGGTVGGLALSRQIDRRGVGAISVLFGCAVPVVGVIGIFGTSEPLLFLLAFLSGFCVLGVQFGVNAVASLVYPTAFRTFGMGWAFAVARVGAILGPVLGGVIIEMDVGIHRIFLFAAIPFAVGLAASLLLGRVSLASNNLERGKPSHAAPLQSVDLG